MLAWWPLQFARIIVAMLQILLWTRGKKVVQGKNEERGEMQWCDSTCNNTNTLKEKKMKNNCHREKKEGKI